MLPETNILFILASGRVDLKMPSFIAMAQLLLYTQMNFSADPCIVSMGLSLKLGQNM